MNILNPALTARAFCFFAFAQQMSGDKVWVAPNEALVLNGVQLGETKATLMHEAVTMATPLGNAAKTGTAIYPIYSRYVLGYNSWFGRRNFSISLFVGCSLLDSDRCW